MSEKLTCTVDNDIPLKKKIIPFSEADVLDRIRWNSETLRNKEKLPKFKKHQDFIDSSFFKNFYDLWSSVISVNTEKHKKQTELVVWWDPLLMKEKPLLTSVWRVRKLQMILIILWFMKEKHLYWNGISFFWVAGQKTFAAVDRFQKHFCLDTDKSVGDKTKEALYQAIYHQFHREQKQDVYSASTDSLLHLKDLIRKD